MSYDEWVKSISADFTGDALWSLVVYRKALYLAHLCWDDAKKLYKTALLRDLASQLLRAVDSISANIAEGYGRRTGKDKSRFLEYALGSAREARDWYYKSGRVLPPEITAARIALLTEIIKMLTTLIPRQRQRSIREEPDTYTT